MKKRIVLFILGILLLAGVAWGAITTSYIGIETILNRVFDSTNNALKASITGDATLTDLTVSGDTALNGDITYQTDKYVVCSTFTSAGINACIDALGAEGGEVYLPEGDYDCTGVITIDYNNTTIRGAGCGTRLLATNRLTYTTVTGTPAAGETITGDTTGYTATVVKVDTTNKIVWYRSVSNAANFDDTTPENLSWSGGADTLITASSVSEQDFIGIDFNDKQYVNICDLSMVGGSGGGNTQALVDLGTASSTYSVLQNISLTYSDSQAIYAHSGGSTEYILIKDCLLDNNDQAALEATGTYYKILNNTITNNKADGLYFNCSHSTVANNYIAFNTSRGIRLLAPYSNAQNNICYQNGNGQPDILINDDYCIAIGNVCFSTAGKSEQGVYLDEADYCVVMNNVCAGHDTCGIKVDSDCQNVVLAGNNCMLETTPYVNNGTDGMFTVNDKLQRSVTSGITASTTQSQGQQPLTTDINEISTCTNANDVVTLPSAIKGLTISIFNNGAQTLQIYPASGDDLGAGVNNSTTLAAGSNVTYIAYDTTNWEAE